MERRTFLRASALGAGTLAFTGSLWQDALAAPAQNAPGPYGPLLAADGNGIQLPAGFTSQVIARSGQTVPGTSYTWHSAPDGGACFADDGGWIYVSNSEVNPGGGASAIRFDSGGVVVSAVSILSGTRQNCAGGATPWNTWLSCEEVSRGYVYETHPFGGAAVQRPALGRFKHEAAAADPVRKVVYLTEDETDGRFYRFVPATWGDLSSGRLQVLRAGSTTSGAFTWADVPDPGGSPTATRSQVSGSKPFNGGEGCYYANDTVWFTTKGDNRVWQVDVAAGTYELAYDDNLVSPGTAPLTGVDNLTGSASGDLYVAEDGGNMEICLITPDDKISPFLRINGQGSSEITGPAFNPAGDRLYFSSQRGTSGSSSGGITYCVSGPFRT
ncbi:MULTISPECIES: alkaline phosphatase PhoX [Streptosporangium]|uniref:Secreted PhoX family phosphatase n=1 Tax=Streptosporangium brasiliense TaxID=47480 RepID=A0ABT9RDD7_9ACTN|nr:alkaline phosphatase PhoX [Streptosporangium brasiliense]MDP9866886.1 secreted PhoX family phosphatase [Streptosporangium brasiliense]